MRLISPKINTYATVMIKRMTENPITVKIHLEPILCAFFLWYIWPYLPKLSLESVKLYDHALSLSIGIEDPRSSIILVILKKKWPNISPEGYVDSST